MLSNDCTSRNAESARNATRARTGTRGAGALSLYDVEVLQRIARPVRSFPFAEVTMKPRPPFVPLP